MGDDVDGSSEASTVTKAELAAAIALQDQAEILYRQVHPKQTKPDGSPASVAFVPTERDEDLLSTHRQRIGPDEAYRRWTEELGHQSVGTYGIAVGEAVGIGLRALDDETPAIPDHASLDFSEVPSKGEKRQRGRKLKEFAAGRGCLHLAEEA